MLHCPWWVAQEITTADNLRYMETNGAIDLPADAREVRIHWVNGTNPPALSYERAVNEYRAEYARRYQMLMHGESAGKN